MSKPGRIALGLEVLLILGLAGLRLAETHREIAATDVEFTQFNQLTWDPSTGRLEVLGVDPFAMLTIPAECIPLDHLRLEFEGAPYSSAPFWAYPSPAKYSHLVIVQELAVTGAVEPTNEGWAIDFDLGGCRWMRFDLPDTAGLVFTLRKATFSTPFVSANSTTFALLMAAIVALGIGLFMHFGQRWLEKPWVETLSATGLVLLKLALMAGMGLTLFSNFHHDDGLFMNLGAAIADGQWLGEFNALTLVKGPTYPLFLGLVAKTGLPLQLAQTLLHAVACCLFVQTLRPWIRGAGWRLLLLGALLFEPHALSAAEMARVLRGCILPALVLITLAGPLAILSRPALGSRGRIGWMTLCGAGFTLFWYCREEGLWLVPSLGVLLGAIAWRDGVRGNSRIQRVVTFSTLVIPLAFFAVGNLSLRSANARNYGAFVDVDVKSGSFPAAYGALLRVKPASSIEGVLVTHETRQRIYAVSPAFALLESSLENDMMQGWGEQGWGHRGVAKVPHEFRSGWLAWALRDAASATGQYVSGASAQHFWQTVADEVNAACEDGRLEAGPPRHGLFPPLREADLAPILDAWRQATMMIMRFDGFSAQPMPSSGDRSDVERFAALWNSVPVIETPPADARSEVRIVIATIFETFGPWAGLVGLVSFLSIAVRSIGTAYLRLLTLTLLSFCGGVVALGLVTALVDVTSFPALHPMYLRSASPLFITFVILSLHRAFSSRKLDRSGEANA